MKPPGEQPRHGLRWHIRVCSFLGLRVHIYMRVHTLAMIYPIGGVHYLLTSPDLPYVLQEQLLQDNPVIVAPPPAPPVRKPSNYVVPTSKKRQNLRWAIRHQLAQK